MSKVKLIIDDIEFDKEAKGYMVLQSVKNKKKKNGELYCQYTLSDGKKSITINDWNHTKETAPVQEKTIIGIVFTKTKNGEFINYNISWLKPADDHCELSVSDFVTSPTEDISMMYDSILSMISETVNGQLTGTLAELVANIFEANKDKLLYWSAAETIHHNMYGGLLYHTYRMVKQAKVLATVYSSLDAELLLAATALHDIGKLEELDTDQLGIAEYTIDGNLQGHAYIGMRMVEEYAKNGEYDAEKIRCLTHCIASHHGNLEWGAIQKPHIEEAAVLHYIDMIDSRVQQYETIYDGMKPGELSEDKVFGLDNVCVYKPKFKPEQTL